MLFENTNISLETNNCHKVANINELSREKHKNVDICVIILV